MKKSTKGFTLIELLAVIVILAIIALIATPIVLNLINTARKGAAARSAEGIRDAAKKSYFAALTEDPNAWSDDVEVSYPSTNIDKIEIDGQAPTEGNVTIKSTGEVTGTDLKFGAYYCSFGNTGSAKCDTSKVGALS